MYKKGFIFIPKMHLKKDLFYFGKGCEKKVQVLHKYDRKVKRNEKDNKLYINGTHVIYVHQQSGLGRGSAE